MATQTRVLTVLGRSGTARSVSAGKLNAQDRFDSLGKCYPRHQVWRIRFLLAPDLAGDQGVRDGYSEGVDGIARCGFPGGQPRWQCDAVEDRFLYWESLPTDHQSCGMDAVSYRLPGVGSASFRAESW
ncbi:MAG: hypothetical protein OSA98_04055 [Rubripirellula sp.]|nr:hypothetical protein [Rubripirellula sp.]